VKEATGAQVLIHHKDAKWLTRPSTSYAEAMRAMGLGIEKPDFPCLECGRDALRWEFQADPEKMTVECSGCGFAQEYRSLSPPDRVLEDGDHIKIGDLGIKVIHTPGHSEGTIALYLESENTILTRHADALHVHELSKLPDHVVVFPSHGERTTIREVREPPENQVIAQRHFSRLLCTYPSPDGQAMS
jgi:glyoxylase-like metal-dependent hydrolase (beta-lactamase superfamily II)